MAMTEEEGHPALLSGEAAEGHHDDEGRAD